MSEQMNDAALSVMFNISEGFLRRRDGETSQFLRYAFASNGELKSGYYAAETRRHLDAAETADLIALNGSRRVARRAGTMHATAATIVSSATIETSVNGSRGLV